LLRSALVRTPRSNYERRSKREAGAVEKSDT
jgi:hypothetical protein